MRLNSDLVGEGNEIRGFRFDEGSALPTDPFFGQLFHLHIPGTISKVFYFDGAQWICGVTSINGKQGDLTLTAADVGLGNVDNTKDVDKPISTATSTAITSTSLFDRNRANHTGSQLSSTISDFSLEVDNRITLQAGQPNGLSTLDGAGKVPLTQMPANAVTTVSVVNSQEAQLSLPTQQGDVVIRTDLSATFIRNGGLSGSMSDWTQMANPNANVLSVNGMTGTVTVSAADLHLGDLVDTRPSYTHMQEQSQTVWTITHNLGYNPAGVIVTSDDGYMLDGFVVQYLTTGISLRVSFDLSFSGTAVLS